MAPDQIELGAVYRCKGGWYRSPIAFELRDGAPEVRYRLGWDESVSQSKSSGPLPWFALTALERVR